MFNQQGVETLLDGVRKLFSDIAKVDSGASNFSHGFDAACAVTAPLVIGFLTRRPADGSIAAVAALLAGMVSFQGAHRSRLLAIIVCGLIMSIYGFVGALVSTNSLLFTVVVAFAAGLAALSVSLGPLTSLVLQQSLLLMAVSSALPSDFRTAVIRSLLILLGAWTQALIVALSWFRAPGRTESIQISGLFERLARYCTEVSTTTGVSPPLFPDYHYLISDPNPRLDPSTLAKLLRYLHDAENIRLQLVGLTSIVDRARSYAPQGDNVEVLFKYLADRLTLVADTVDWSQQGRPLRVEPQFPLEDYHAFNSLSEAIGPGERQILHSVLAEINGLTQSDDAQIDTHVEAALPFRTIRDRIALQIKAAGQVVLSNLNLNSDTGRHALRTAITAVVAVAVARYSGLSRGYWVIITVSVVLKPDYSTTLRRSVERITGTVIGVGVASVVLITLNPTEPALLAMILTVSIFAYALFPASYTIFVSLLSALVIILLHVAGLAVESTAGARLLDTAVGGAIALLAYRVWPTWGDSETFTRIAALIRSQSRYANAVLSQLRADRAQSADASEAALTELLIRARASRIAAEASLDRISNEPREPAIPLRQREMILLATRDFARACLEVHSAVHLIASSDAMQQGDDFTEAIESFSNWLTVSMAQSAYEFDSGKLSWAHNRTTVHSPIVEAQTYSDPEPAKSLKHLEDLLGSHSRGAVPTGIGAALSAMKRSADLLTTLTSAGHDIP